MRLRKCERPVLIGLAEAAIVKVEHPFLLNKMKQFVHLKLRRHRLTRDNTPTSSNTSGFTPEITTQKANAFETPARCLKLVWHTVTLDQNKAGEFADSSRPPNP
jgi:hypothetical protein